MGSAPKLGCVHPKAQTALVSHALFPPQRSVAGSLWLLLLLMSPVKAGSESSTAAVRTALDFYPNADNALRVKKNNFDFRTALRALSLYLFSFLG